MGVTGLTRFIKANEHSLFQSYNLNKTRVIIDGHNIVHFLWENSDVNQRYGGDYNHFADSCRRFFILLRECECRPYVVFHGGRRIDDENDKMYTDRKQRRIKSVETMIENGTGNVLPILAVETFRQVLVEMNVPHVTCQYGSEKEIAVLAKRWQCPVMSTDSDFFAFDLPDGFILLDFLRLPIKPPITCLLFKHQQLLTICQLKPELAPLFASLLGNDDMDTRYLTVFYEQNQIDFGSWEKGRYPDVSMMVDWINTRTDIESGLRDVLKCVTTRNRDKVKETLKRSIDKYRNVESFENFDIEKFFEHYDKFGYHACMQNINLYVQSEFISDAMPAWFHVSGRHGWICRSLQMVAGLRRRFHDCQVENLKKRTSHHCSKKIRAVVYGIIFGKTIPHVVEWDREGKTVIKTMVTPRTDLEGFTPLPTLKDIPFQPKDKLFELILTILGLPEYFSSADAGMDPVSKLLIGVLRHCIKYSKPKVTLEICHSVIVGTIALHSRYFAKIRTDHNSAAFAHLPVSEDIKAAFIKSTEGQISSFHSRTESYFQQAKTSFTDCNIVHGISQFQACLADTFQLNEILMKPIEPPSPSFIINATFVYNMCLQLQAGASLATIMINNSPMHQHFLKIISHVFGNEVEQGDEDVLEGESLL